MEDPSFRALVLRARNHLNRPGPVPEMRLASLTRRTPSLVVRQDVSSTSSSAAATTTCGKFDNSGACEKYYNPTDANIPIILGVVIPISVALILMFFLHRRHVRKLRKEDAEDRDKALDFGIQEEGMSTKKIKRKRGKKDVPEMALSEAKETIRQDRGMSLDMALQNPYLLPPGLQHSRESLQSMSRSLHTADDKYHATDFIPDDGSIRSPSSLRSRMDDGSSFTGSVPRRFDTESSKGLLPVHNSSFLAPKLPDAGRDSYLSTTSSNGAVAALRASNNYLGAFISGGNKKIVEQKNEQITTLVTELPSESPIEAPRQPAEVFLKNEPGIRQSIYEMAANRDSFQPTIHDEVTTTPQPRLPEFNRMSALSSHIDVYEFPGSEPVLSTTEPVQHELPVENSHYGHQNVEALHEPISHEPNESIDHDARSSDYYDDEGYEGYEDYLRYGDRHSRMSVRPLPPDDPSENPEERAIRIRSFYKEYFDETDPNKSTNAINYYDGSEDYVDNYYEQSAPRPPRMPYSDGRQRAMSSGSYMSGSRVPSVMSGRGGGYQPRMTPKKRLPPPKPLQMLPTPGKLKDDSFLPNAADYAPPQIFKNQRAGTPDSLRGGSRPYSPSVRAHVPLASSFDDLGVMPSPHAMGDSSAYTGLDFAPPRRFRDGETMSDSGSIRSNQSAMSARQLDSIRKGAYRVSRIPKEIAGTRNELHASLRPKMDMNR